MEWYFGCSNVCNVSHLSHYFKGYANAIGIWTRCHIKHKIEADWAYIKANKQKIIKKNNEQENAKRTPYMYKVGEQVLYKNEMVQKFGQNPYSGPYQIRKINTNGTVRIKIGSILETMNIRLIKPYCS